MGFLLFSFVTSQHLKNVIVINDAERPSAKEMNFFLANLAPSRLVLEETACSNSNRDSSGGKGKNPEIQLTV